MSYSLFFGDCLEEMKKLAREAYQTAMEIGKAEQIDSTNSIMLGLALNFSVFYYEIENDAQKVSSNSLI